jgi:hypothetical protein
MGWGAASTASCAMKDPVADLKVVAKLLARVEAGGRES